MCRKNAAITNICFIPYPPPGHIPPPFPVNLWGRGCPLDRLIRLFSLPALRPCSAVCGVFDLVRHPGQRMDRCAQRHRHRRLHQSASFPHCRPAGRSVQSSGGDRDDRLQRIGCRKHLYHRRLWWRRPRSTLCAVRCSLRYCSLVRRRMGLRHPHQ